MHSTICETENVDPLLQPLKDETCSICDGLGMRIIDDEAGQRHVEPCECRYYKRALRGLKRANIPRRFEACTFETFNSKVSSLAAPANLAPGFLQSFIEDYPFDHSGTGLLITGDIGTGKTHLAVATLRSLITQYNKVGLFYDYRTLLKQNQNTYSSRTAESESDVLDPVYKADVLVLDELGAEKRTDWTSDMVAHIINLRYNEQRTTIFTTNYANKSTVLARKELALPNSSNMPTIADETLGDRIGERMFSRIQEMCIIIEMKGDDFRKGIKRPLLQL